MNTTMSSSAKKPLSGGLAHPGGSNDKAQKEPSPHSSEDLEAKRAKPPQRILKLGKFEVVRWENGNYTLRRYTYDPKSQQPITQHINLAEEEIPVLKWIADRLLIRLSE